MNREDNVRPRWLGAVALSLITACTATAPIYSPPEGKQGCWVSDESGPIEMIVKPMWSVEERTKFFRMHDFLPVYIRIRHGGSEGIYLFDPSHTLIESEGAEYSASIPESLRTEAGGVLTWSPLLVWSPQSRSQLLATKAAFGALAIGVVLVEGTRRSEATIARHALYRDMLCSSTLSPGEELAGFVYFPDIPIESRSARMNLRCSLLDMNKRDEFDILAGGAEGGGGQ